MVNVKKANESASKLAALKFFPADTTARLAIVGIICEMAGTNEQIDWLVSRMLVLYNEWPGPKELRACYCSRFKPKDGVEARSTVFLDGIPSEKKPEPMLALPPGTTVPAAHKLENGVRLLARSKAIDRPARLPAPRVPEIPTNPSYVPVTAADVERAAAEHRAKRRAEQEAAAREEAGL